MKLNERNIGLAILFTIITCGIYGIYWFICLVNDVKTVTGDESLPTGGMAFLLSIITCGIYEFYLFYKMGKSLYDNKVTNDDNSIIYLVLPLFGFSIINYCLIQHTLNQSTTPSGDVS